MKKTYKSLGVLFAVGLISLVQACQKDDQFSAVPDTAALKKTGFLNNPDRTFYSPTPSVFQKDGYYPTQYRVTYSGSPKQYTIALLNLQYHEGE